MKAIQKLFKDTSSSLLTNFVTILAGIGVNVILARTIGPPGRGSVAILVLFASVFAYLVNCGLGASNVYFIRNKKSSANALFANSIIWVCISSLVGAVLYWVSYLILRDTALQGLEIKSVILSCLIIPLSISTILILHILIGLDQFFKVNLAVVLQQMAYLLIICLTALLNFISINVVIVAYLFSLGTNLICVKYFLRKFLIFPLRADMKVLREGLSYGIPVQVGTLLQFLASRVDLFLINAFLDVGNVGIYVIAVQIAEIGLFVPNAIAFALLAPSGTQDGSDANEFGIKTAKYVVIIGIITSIFVAVFCQLIITSFFGQAFFAAVIPTLLLLPGILSLSLFKVLSSHAIVGGKSRIFAQSTIAGFLSLVSLDLLLIPQAGLTGAAVASTISSFIATIVFVKAFCSLNKIDWHQFLPNLEDLRIMFSDLRGFILEIRHK